MTCRAGSYHRAYVNGLEAALSLPQVPRTANPYPDHRTDRGAITYSRTWRRTWDEGWRDGDRAMRETTA